MHSADFEDLSKPPWAPGRILPPLSRWPIFHCPSPNTKTLYIYSVNLPSCYKWNRHKTRQTYNLLVIYIRKQQWKREAKEREGATPRPLSLTYHLLSIHPSPYSYWFQLNYYDSFPQTKVNATYAHIYLKLIHTHIYELRLYKSRVEKILREGGPRPPPQTQKKHYLHLPLHLKPWEPNESKQHYKSEIQKYAWLLDQHKAWSMDTDSPLPSDRSPSPEPWWAPSQP